MQQLLQLWSNAIIDTTTVNSKPVPFESSPCGAGYTVHCKPLLHKHICVLPSIYIVFWKTIKNVLKFIKTLIRPLSIRVVWFIRFVGWHSVRGLHYSAQQLPQCLKHIGKASTFKNKLKYLPLENKATLCNKRVPDRVLSLTSDSKTYCIW